ATVPTEAVDLGQLARLQVPGGNIRNIALGAAFLAADDGGAVTMDHLLQAARREYAKLERPLTDAEIGGWRWPRPGSRWWWTRSCCTTSLLPTSMPSGPRSVRS